MFELRIIKFQIGFQSEEFRAIPKSDSQPLNELVS